MYRRLVAITLTTAPIALAVSAIAAGITTTAPSWWRAAVHLAVLGGIAMMIYGVNIRIVPVFARRSWRSERLLVAQVVAGGAGAWVSFLGIGVRSTVLAGVGQTLALAGGVLFMANIAMLFRQQPGAAVAPPARHEEQVDVDPIATRFTRLSGTWLLLGLATGVALTWWHPSTGRWDLVWAHMLLIGFFLSMASGVCYHVLPRWTGRPWRSIALIRWHYHLVLAGLPLMVLALAVDHSALFLLAGPIQAVAIALLLLNIAPHAWSLRGAVRGGIVVASACLVLGVSLGVAFAIDPAIGPRLRQAHAVANLFGWAGLLISGFGYNLVPGFSGGSLRWPRLAMAQIVVLATGVLAGVGAIAWRMYGSGPEWAIILSQAVVALGLGLFALQVAAIFASPPQPPSPIRILPAPHLS